MNLTKNVLLSIINTGFYFSLITVLNLHLNINIALAGGGGEIRKITRVEWESGEKMNCGGKGVEYLVTYANVHFMSRQSAIYCLSSNNKSQADWVILGGFDISAKPKNTPIQVQRFRPETQNSGNKPNLYSYAKFVIGYNCIAKTGIWVCEKYSASIENNVLKTFGSQKLEYIPVGDIPFRFNEDVEGSAYITTNE